MLIASSEGTERELIPAGMHTAVCYGVVDLGLRVVEFNGNEKLQRKLMIFWELPEETIETEDGPAPRSIGKQYTLSLHERSSLYQMLSAWRNKAFTDEELAGFDLRQIVGKGCQLSIAHEQSSNGKTYANIKAIVGLPKGMTAPPPTRTMIFDLDDPEALSKINDLPEWLQMKIKESETYKGLAGVINEPWPEDKDLPF